jgi:hypothetical protein
MGCLQLLDYFTVCGVPRLEGATRYVSVAWLGGLGFDLMDIAASFRAVDDDTPQLHGFRDFPQQLDPEQSIFKSGALDLYVVRQTELPLEMPGRDPPAEEVSTGLVGFIALDGDDVLSSDDRHLVGRIPRPAAQYCRGNCPRQVETEKHSMRPPRGLRVLCGSSEGRFKRRPLLWSELFELVCKAC